MDKYTFTLNISFDSHDEAIEFLRTVEVPLGSDSVSKKDLFVQRVDIRDQP